MSDENGPYKLVQKRVKDITQTQELKYSIVRSSRDGINGEFLKEVVPDAGDGQMARQIVGLLNRQWREMAEDNRRYEQEYLARFGVEEEVKDDSPDGAA